jgi:hypothetical protein
MDIHISKSYISIYFDLLCSSRQRTATKSARLESHLQRLQCKPVMTISSTTIARRIVSFITEHRVWRNYIVVLAKNNKFGNWRQRAVLLQPTEKCRSELFQSHFLSIPNELDRKRTGRASFQGSV